MIGDGDGEREGERNVDDCMVLYVHRVLQDFCTYNDEHIQIQDDTRMFQEQQRGEPFAFSEGDLVLPGLLVTVLAPGYPSEGSYLGKQSGSDCCCSD